MKSALILPAAAGLAALISTSGVAGQETTYGIPFSPTAPNVDGVAEAGEWDATLRIVGAGSPVDARYAEISFAWDEEHLYVMTKGETAPRNRLATCADSRDGSQRIVMDDSVELWFDPPKALRNADETKRLGIFQMIVSHNGNAYGCHHDPGYGLPARDWNLKAVSKAWSITNDVWTLEMAIPAKAFGLASFKPMELPLLAVRNFRMQGGWQAPFLQPGGGFMDAAHYPKMRLAGGAQSPAAADARERVAPVVIDRRPASQTPFAWNTPEACIVAEGGEARDVKIPIPGSIVMRAKTAGGMEKKGWRRYFATQYRPSGYLGFQEDTNNGRTMLFFAHGFTGAPDVNKRFKCPADGREAVVAVNFEPRKVTYYLNGVKQGETDLPVDLSVEKLGDLVLGGGEPGLEIADWTLFRRTLTDAEIKARSQGDSPVSGTLAWYPYLNALVADLTCDATKFADRALAWRVTARGGTNALASGRISLADGFQRDGGGRSLTLVRAKLPLGVDLAEGDYVAALEREGEDDALVEREFTVRKYDWFKNDLGKEDRLLPGFTPVEAVNGLLRCVGRDYEIGANGFPVHVVADGEQILAAPVALWAEKEGRSWELGGPQSSAAAEARERVHPVFRKVSDTRAEYEATTGDYAVKGSLEQDGLLRFTMDFKCLPDADRVWLEIPVKKEFATLFHACGEGVRANPAGFVPAGEGVVFGSRAIPQTHVSNFIPYCWVGTDTRGICYAADTDFGWVLSETRDAVEIVRKADGAVSIVLNLLNDLGGRSSPAVADARGRVPHVIELALMASPVKPMPKGWRGWTNGFGYKGTRHTIGLGSPPYWGCLTGWAGRYPAWGDFEYVRKLREAMDTGQIDNAYVKKRIDRVCSSASPETSWVNGMEANKKREYVSRHIWCAFTFAKSLHGKPNPLLYFYTCDADGAQPLAEFAVFRGEWAAGARVTIPSCADYAIWYLNKMLEAGMQGVYDDNTFIFCNFNWATGEAKVDGEGNVHPSFGIWNCREYRRRQANVLAARGLFPWITVHHTNGNILPVLGFAMNSMGMEWKYGKSDFQTRFTPDYIRAVCQGLQGGFFPTVLDGIQGLGGEANKAERIRVTRTMLASLLVHEVRPTWQRSSDAKTIVDTMNILMDFGIGADDCSYTAYWDAANPVVCSDRDVYVSVYRRGGKLLAVCGSWADGDRDVELTLKFGKFADVKNAETGETIPVSAGRIRFTIRKHDLNLVECEIGEGDVR